MRKSSQLVYCMLSRRGSLLLDTMLAISCAKQQR